MLVVGRHAVEPVRRRAVRLGPDPLGPLKHLAREPHVRVGDTALLLHRRERVLVGTPVPPHEVRYHHGARPGHPLRAVHQDSAAALDRRLLDEVEAVVQHGGYVLVGGVLQPHRLVHQVGLEVVRNDESDAVDDVRDAVLVEGGSILRDSLAADVHAWDDLRAVLLEVRELLASNLKLGLVLIDVFPRPVAQRAEVEPHRPVFAERHSRDGAARVGRVRRGGLGAAAGRGVSSAAEAQTKARRLARGQRRRRCRARVPDTRETQLGHRRPGSRRAPGIARVRSAPDRRGGRVVRVGVAAEREPVAVDVLIRVHVALAHLCPCSADSAAPRAPAPRAFSGAERVDNFGAGASVLSSSGSPGEEPPTDDAVFRYNRATSTRTHTRRRIAHQNVRSAGS